VAKGDHPSNGEGWRSNALLRAVLGECDAHGIGAVEVGRALFFGSRDDAVELVARLVKKLGQYRRQRKAKEQYKATLNEEMRPWAIAILAEQLRARFAALRWQEPPELAKLPRSRGQSTIGKPKAAEARNIVLHALALGRSRGDAAKEAGVTVAAISKWLKNDPTFQSEMAKRRMLFDLIEADELVTEERLRDLGLL